MGLYCCGLLALRQTTVVNFKELFSFVSCRHRNCKNNICSSSRSCFLVQHVAEFCKVLSRHRMRLRFLAHVGQRETETAFLMLWLMFPHHWRKEKKHKLCKSKILGNLETLKAYFHFPHCPSMCQSTSEKSDGSRRPANPTFSSLPHPPVLSPATWRGVVLNNNTHWNQPGAF